MKKDEENQRRLIEKIRYVEMQSDLKFTKKFHNLLSSNCTCVSPCPSTCSKAMFTRDRSGTDPVRFSDRIGLLFTRDRSGTGPEQIQNWTCCFAGPVSDPIRTGFRKVPCKHLDRFQTVPCKQKPIRSGSVRNGSGPVPCKRSPSLSCFLTKDENNDYRAEIRDETCVRAKRAII